MHKIERSGELVLQHGRSESQQPLVRGKKLTIINDDDDDDDDDEGWKCACSI